MAGFYGGTPGHSNIISLKASALTKALSKEMSIGEKVIIESSDPQKNGEVWEKISNIATSGSGSDVSTDFFYIGKLKGAKGDKNSVYQIVKNVAITVSNNYNFLTEIANALSDILTDNSLWVAQKTILVQGTITKSSTTVPFERLVILKTKKAGSADGEVIDLGPIEQYTITSSTNTPEQELQELQPGKKVFKYKPI